jgi:formylglycine-generating enzyme required for sulfatase activity
VQGPAAKEMMVLDLGGGQQITLKRISLGAFQMGSPAGEEGQDGDEQPQHKVTLTKPYFMAIHTVTRGQFRAFVTATGYQTDGEKDGKGGSGYDAAADKFEQSPKYNWMATGFEQSDKHPVVNVSWNDAQAFCTWLSQKSGHKVTLPTEAQWEYACRAGTQTRYFTGDAEASLEGYANVRDQTVKDKFPKVKDVFPFRDGYVFTSPVGSFKANPLGLYDMHGNVFQWCQDWFDEKYYHNSPNTDPQGPDSGQRRAMRGGSWLRDARHCRSAWPGGVDPGLRDAIVGFRVTCLP